MINNKSNSKGVFRTIFFTILICIIQVQGVCQISNDTTFLYRNVSHDSYNAIYIDYNKNSIYYDELMQSILIDINVYSNVILKLKDSGFNLRKDFKINFASDWYSLHLYKNKYYIYFPSEPYTNSWFGLNDSCLITNDFNDGCIPAFIENINWLDNKTVEIKTNGLYKKNNILKIHFINKAKDVAVFEFPTKPKENRYLLMVSKRSLRKYPLIVNYCKENRVQEWSFDKPNFVKLLNNSFAFFLQ